MLFPLCDHSLRLAYQDSNNKYKKAIVYVDYKFNKRVRWIKKNVRSNIIRVPNKGKVTKPYSDELLQHLQFIKYVYCYRLKKVVNIKYCFTRCRLEHKLNCKLYMDQCWGCLYCPDGNRYQTCKYLSNCEFKYLTSLCIRFLFSHWFGFDYHTIRAFTIGRGYIANYKGIGPQLYCVNRYVKKVVNNTPLWKVRYNKTNRLRRLRLRKQNESKEGEEERRK